MNMKTTVLSFLLAATAFLPAASATGQSPAAPAASTTGTTCPQCATGFAGRDLRGKNFASRNLAGADFSNALLDGTVFTFADLRGARFAGARFGKLGGVPTRFAGALLQQADFSGAVFEGTDFQYAALGCADFSRADLSGAVVGVTLDLAAPPGATCKADFKGARLSCEPGFAAADRRQLAGARKADCPAAAQVADGVVCGAADLSGLTSAVYVAADGSDSGSCGQSTDAPCLTIQQAIDLCSGSGCGVLVACGQYQPAATLNLPSGVSVYGGCTWDSSGSATYQSMVTAPPGGSPAFAASGTSPGYLQGFLIGGSAATAFGAPSVALSFIGSTGPTLSYITVTAGHGAQGQPGATGANGQTGGNASNSSTAGGASSCGAAGGNGGGGGTATAGSKANSCVYSPASSSSSGQPGSTGYAAPGGAAALIPGEGCTSSSTGEPVDCNGQCPNVGNGSSTPTGGGGTSGNPGTCGANGQAATAAAADGAFGSGGWSGIAGGAGTDGGAGGGGGGGGAGLSCLQTFGWNESSYNGGDGGGGGAGGCGASGGGGGGQGGASIGVQIIEASVTFGPVVQLIAGTGGAGGNGGTGGASAGGGWGLAAYDAQGCATQGGNGGYGGNGGAGGAGAGGNGGPSYALALVSAASPAGINGVTFNVGNGGTFGAGGTSGSGTYCPATTAAAGLAAGATAIYTTTVSN